MGFKDFIVFVGFKLFQVNLVVDLSRICILVYFEAWYQRILWVDFGAQLALETIGRQRQACKWTEFTLISVCEKLKICENLLKDNLCIKTLPEAQLTQKLTP